jgi:hypothetical protein
MITMGTVVLSIVKLRFFGHFLDNQLEQSFYNERFGRKSNASVVQYHC